MGLCTDMESMAIWKKGKSGKWPKLHLRLRWEVCTFALGILLLIAISACVSEYGTRPTCQDASGYAFPSRCSWYGRCAIRNHRSPEGRSQRSLEARATRYECQKEVGEPNIQSADGHRRQNQTVFYLEASHERNTQTRRNQAYRRHSKVAERARRSAARAARHQDAHRGSLGRRHGQCDTRDGRNEKAYGRDDDTDPGSARAKLYPQSAIRHDAALQCPDASTRNAQPNGQWIEGRIAPASCNASSPSKDWGSARNTKDDSGRESAIQRTFSFQAEPRNSQIIALPGGQARQEDGQCHKGQEAGRRGATTTRWRHSTRRVGRLFHHGEDESQESPHDIIYLRDQHQDFLSLAILDQRLWFDLCFGTLGTDWRFLSHNLDAGTNSTICSQFDTGMAVNLYTSFSLRTINTILIFTWEWLLRHQLFVGVGVAIFLVGILFGNYLFPRSSSRRSCVQSKYKACCRRADNKIQRRWHYARRCLLRKQWLAIGFLYFCCSGECLPNVPVRVIRTRTPDAPSSVDTREPMLNTYNHTSDYDLYCHGFQHCSGDNFEVPDLFSLRSQKSFCPQVSQMLFNDWQKGELAYFDEAVRVSPENFDQHNFDIELVLTYSTSPDGPHESALEKDDIVSFMARAPRTTRSPTSRTRWTYPITVFQLDRHELTMHVPMQTRYGTLREEIAQYLAFYQDEHIWHNFLLYRVVPVPSELAILARPTFLVVLPLELRERQAHILTGVEEHWTDRPTTTSFEVLRSPFMITRFDFLQQIRALTICAPPTPHRCEITVHNKLWRDIDDPIMLYDGAYVHVLIRYAVDEICESDIDFAETSEAFSTETDQTNLMQMPKDTEQNIAHLPPIRDDGNDAFRTLLTTLYPDMAQLNLFSVYVYRITRFEPSSITPHFCPLQRKYSWTNALLSIWPEMQEQALTALVAQPSPTSLTIRNNPITIILMPQRDFLQANAILLIDLHGPDLYTRQSLVTYSQETLQSLTRKLIAHWRLQEIQHLHGHAVQQGRRIIYHYDDVLDLPKGNHLQIFVHLHDEQCRPAEPLIPDDDDTEQADHSFMQTYSCIRRDDYVQRLIAQRRLSDPSRLLVISWFHPWLERYSMAVYHREHWHLPSGCLHCELQNLWQDMIGRRPLFVTLVRSMRIPHQPQMAHIHLILTTVDDPMIIPCLAVYAKGRRWQRGTILVETYSIQTPLRKLFMLASPQHDCDGCIMVPCSCRWKN